MDMSAIAIDWVPSESQPTAGLLCDGAKSINLDLRYADAAPGYHGSKILLIQALAKGEELWAVRMLPSGRLLIGLGTAGSRETEGAYFPEAHIGISYSPITGRLSVLVKEPEERLIDAETVIATAHNAWAPEPPGRDYEILLGAPDTYADRAPLGWRISASFRYGEEGLPLQGGGALVPVAHEEERAPSQAERARLHWEAMMTITGAGDSKEAVDNMDDAQWIAAQADRLVNAHLAWCKENKE